MCLGWRDESCCNNCSVSCTILNKNNFFYGNGRWVAPKNGAYLCLTVFSAQLYRLRYKQNHVIEWRSSLMALPRWRFNCVSYLDWPAIRLQPVMATIAAFCATWSFRQLVPCSSEDQIEAAQPWIRRNNWWVIICCGSSKKMFLLSNPGGN